jgi:hypothetical protein
LGRLGDGPAAVSLRPVGKRECVNYSITKGQQAIIEFTRAMRDTTGNLPPLPGVFPDYMARPSCATRRMACAN